MKDIITLAHEYGQRAAARNTLPDLALLVAEQAAAGDLDEDSAAEIYEAYYKSAHRVTSVHLGAPSMRVQISKLRTIIKASHHHKRTALRLFKLVLKEYNKGELNRLYECMVSIARLMHDGKAPSATLVERVLKK